MIPPYIWTGATFALATLAAVNYVASARNLSMAKRLRAYMDEDRAVANWARWTTLSLVLNDGRMYTRTLLDLRHEQPILGWDQPISVCVLQGAPVDAEFFEGDHNGRPDTSPGRRPTRAVPVEGPQDPHHSYARPEDPHGPPGEAVQP